ncbi:CAP domain-containing protein [Lachnoclostridium phytofermentans]|uniref:SCP-like extracellular n=1 Tax=Lachnoclostridium phytofermentans (strain ATCC 700394 / DSM 18823 / ISDg) TaxID=357809 RepID=A9KHM3_LACP7|nr:CAP domain-containing protein [Lachnoclostridium phytofermentans]ABX42308.1 SCP-like extracellular [Lachnoclostridium phytofermentans ISDg]
MKLTRFVVASMATIATVTTLSTPTAVKAASFNDLCTQLNGNVITVSGSNQDEIMSKLKDYGINLNNLNLENCPGSSNIVVPETEVKKPETEVPKVEVPKVEAPGQSGKNDGGSESKTDLSYAEQVVKLVNEERAKNGLSPLTIDKSVESAALVRSKEIEKSFSHTRPNGSTFSTALKEQGVNYMAAGENIAWGQKSPEEVMQAWMNSEGHRANILNAKFTKIGVGYYQNSNGTKYWTQLFTN